MPCSGGGILTKLPLRRSVSARPLRKTDERTGRTPAFRADRAGAAIAGPTAAIRGTRSEGWSVAAGIFDFACKALERRTGLETLEARGTVRLALKQSGLEVASVDAAQMAVMLRRVMPGELRSRGVDHPDSICDDLIRELKEFRMSSGEPTPSPESPEEIFRRLSGR